VFAQHLYTAPLRELYGNDESIQRSRLQGVQRQVSALRDKYKQIPPNINYADINVRTAYLLAYYPHYIMVLARILDGVQDAVQVLMDGTQNPTAGFFGAGAGPEILGWLHVLQALRPDLREATAYTFDLVHWHRELEITQIVAGELFPSIRLHMHHQEVDLTKELPIFYLRQALGSAQFIIVQNCLNDLSKAHHETFIHNMEMLIGCAPSGTLFITTDFIYDHVRSLMEHIQQSAQKQGHCTLQPLDRDICYSPIPLAPIVQEELLTGVGNLIPRRKTQYHSLVIQINPNAESPVSEPQPTRLGLEMRLNHAEKLIFQNLAKLDKSSYTYLRYPKVDTDIAPDLVIVSRDKGVIVAEIRDWRGLQPTNDGRLKVIESSGAEAIYDNPATIVQETATHLKDLYTQRCSGLKMEKDTIAFPWMTRIILPRIRQTAIDAWVAQGIFPPGMVWGYETCCTSENLVAAVEQIGGSASQSALSLTELDILRGILDPALRVLKDEEDIGTFTHKQIGEIRREIKGRPANQPPLFSLEPERDKDDLDVRLIKGVAGSGKTLVLVERAKWLRNSYPDARILVTAFNKKLVEDLNHRLAGEHITAKNFHTLVSSLYREFRWSWPQNISSTSALIEHSCSDLLKMSGLSSEFVAREFEWRREMQLDDVAYLENTLPRRRRGTPLTIEKRRLVNEMYQRYEILKAQRGMADWDTVHLKILEQLRQNENPLQQYDFILLDEAQDFAPSWIALIRCLLKPHGHLLLCEDPSQSIFRGYNWKERNVPVVGRTAVLKVPFRSTLEINKAAHSLIDPGFAEDQEAPDLTTYRLRHGNRPLFIHFDTTREEESFICDDVLKYQGSAEKIAIIDLPQHIRRWERQNWHNVQCGTLRTVKGLEYTTVYVPGLDRYFIDAVDEETRITLKHQIFTAMTRSRRQLILTAVGELPEPLNPLVEHCDYRSFDPSDMGCISSTAS